MRSCILAEAGVLSPEFAARLRWGHHETCDKCSLFWAIYLGVLGAVLVVAPNAILPLFGFQPSGEAWVRVVGALTASFGWYSFWAARAGNASYYLTSAIQRPILGLAFMTFVAAGLAPTGLIGLDGEGCEPKPF